MVSVIIPLYNVEKYIENCLVSLENQEYKIFEVIIINDGSTDNSADLVKAYMQRSDLNISLIEQKNAGVSAARNKGIENSKGKYICFIDSDDMVTPNYLSEMHEIILNNKSDLVICGLKTLDEYKQSNINAPIKLDVENMNSLTGLERFLHRKICPGVGSLLIKAELISKNNLKFTEGYRYSEDIEFIYKLLSNSQRISHTKQQLYLYRVRNDSVMSTVDSKRKDGYELMKGLEEYFSENYPDFSAEFNKFGTARWVWATLWQYAAASSSYNEFKKSIINYQLKKYMDSLKDFPDKKVSTTAFLFSISPRLYYRLCKLYVHRYVNRKFSNTKGMS